MTARPSGPANPIRLHAGSYPEITEVEPNDTPAQATKVPEIPATINGRIGQDGDVDLFSFTGQAQQQLVFEVWAKRLSSELDSYLRILDKDGKELHPHTNYYVGGNTKFYGAALFRLRQQDFGGSDAHRPVATSRSARAFA